MKINYKKHQKGILSNRIKSKLNTIFEKNKKFFYLKSLDFGYLTFNQIKAFKQIINKTLKKFNCHTVYNLNAKIPKTKKPIEVRMGKGKGNVNLFIMKIQSGQILCKIESIHKFLILKAFQEAKKRLPIKTKIYF